MNDSAAPHDADSTVPESSDEQAFDAWVVATTESSSQKVATVALDERWVQAYAFEGATGGRLAPAEVSETLGRAGRPTVVAAGSFAVDQWAVEIVLEAAPGCGAEEVLVPVAPGLPTAPLMCLGITAAKRLAALPNLDLELGLDGALGALKESGITVRELELQASYWGSVSNPDEAKKANWGLLKRLQYRPGGLVAIYLNRPISIRFSRVLADTSISPNQTTLAAFVVGLVGVAMVLLGGYWWAVAGTFLLHVNSVWDGIDGELARLRYQCSDFGAYLDSVCDEFLNAAIVIAAGYHVAAHYGYPAWWGWMGLFGGTMTFVYALIHWHCKWKHGLGFYWWWEAYKPRKEVQRSTSAWFYFKKLFCKDSILLLFLVAALLQFMHVLVLAAAVMGLVNLVLFFIHIVILRARW